MGRSSGSDQNEANHFEDEMPNPPEAIEASDWADPASRTPLDQLCEVVPIHSAEQLFERLRAHDLRQANWAFRGHADATWDLAPSLERLAKTYGELRRDAHQYLLTTFKRHAHQYLRDLPSDGDYLEWLALMRHHGVPSSLLDVTTSPYVAAYFATAEARPNRPSAIWAVDFRAMGRVASEMFSDADAYEGNDRSPWPSDKSGVFGRILAGRDAVHVVIAVQPSRMNERLLAQ